MGEFIRRFAQLNGKRAVITLEHCWFEKQRFEIKQVNVIEDNERLGLILRGQEVFVYKHQLCEIQMDEHIIMFADDKLRILIKF